MRLRRLMMNHEDKFFMWDIKTPLEYSYLRDLILGRVEITGSTPSDETGKPHMLKQIGRDGGYSMSAATLRRGTEMLTIKS